MLFQPDLGLPEPHRGVVRFAQEFADHENHEDVELVASLDATLAARLALPVLAPAAEPAPAALLALLLSAMQYVPPAILLKEKGKCYVILKKTKSLHEITQHGRSR